MKTEVRYCNVCHTAETHKVENTAHYVIYTCEKCQSRTTAKHLTWNVGNMLEPKEWEREK